MAAGIVPRLSLDELAADAFEATRLQREDKC
jgi:hypothetical protein